MPTLVLVRHGESQWNLENKFTGWEDVPLTKQGVKEAWQVGQRLKGMRFDIAFTSVLQRAWKTLEIILKEIGQAELGIFRDKALNERHYGDLQGLNKTETARKFGEEQVKTWRRSYDVAPPNGESLKDTAARTLPFFDKEIVPWLKRGKNVLVVAHGNSLRSIVMRLENLTEEQVADFDLGTGSTRLYEMDNEMKVLSLKSLD